MPRQFRKQKPYIVVFCEGESEQMISELKRLEPGYVRTAKPFRMFMRRSFICQACVYNDLY